MKPPPAWIRALTPPPQVSACSWLDLKSNAATWCHMQNVLRGSGPDHVRTAPNDTSFPPGDVFCHHIPERRERPISVGSGAQQIFSIFWHENQPPGGVTCKNVNTFSRPSVSRRLFYTNLKATGSQISTAVLHQGLSGKRSCCRLNWIVFAALLTQMDVFVFPFSLGLISNGCVGWVL